MSDNWIVQNLNSALQTWSDKLAEIWTLLTQSPENFKGGAIWSVMTNINGGLKAIGYGLLVLFFAAGLVKTCGSFTDMKKPEHVVKAFIRFALAQGAVMSGMELLTAIFSIVQGIVTNIMSHSGMAGGTVTELPSEIVDKIDTVKTDLETIDSLDSKYKLNAKDVYIKTLDLSKALAENKRLADLEEKLEADEAP